MICYECLLYGTRALLIGLPLSVLMFIVIASAVKALREDNRR